MCEATTLVVKVKKKMFWMQRSERSLYCMLGIYLRDDDISTQVFDTKSVIFMADFVPAFNSTRKVHSYLVRYLDTIDTHVLKYRYYNTDDVCHVSSICINIYLTHGATCHSPTTEYHLNANHKTYIPLITVQRLLQAAAHSAKISIPKNSDILSHPSNSSLHASPVYHFINH